MKTINLNENWKFHLGECEEAWYKGYDDEAWRTVMIPHDWSVEAPFSVNHSSGTGYLPGGIGWYRLAFSLPEEYRGKCIKVVFDGVYKNSQIWCNSYYLGKRPNGYTTFSYDLSSFLNFGEAENVICVKVTHTDIADSRWFTGSGITRKVAITVEESVHPEEYGIFFSTEKVEGNKAFISIKQEIRNTRNEAVSLNVRSVLMKESDETSVIMQTKAAVEAEKSSEVTLSGVVSDPDLWSPENPHLYKLKTFYTVPGEAEYLVQEEMVGIRSFCFDAEKGFFLNGIETKIKGVCVHHDGGCLGAAMKQEVWQRRLEILKESGCNAIRCSHNPHMPELYALCDRMGFLMMDEAFDEWENAKNKWSTGHNVYPPRHQGYFEDFPQWHEADLKAMVRRDRNHPSIILWSIGNEIDYPNDPYCHPMFETMTGNNDANKPEKERGYDSNKPNAERLTVIAEKLSAIVRTQDITRPVTLAAAFPELSSELGLFDSLDVVGYNYKEHLYEADHRRFPEKPFLGSENSHRHDAWLAVKDNTYISGQFLWTGIDYLGEAHGWPIRGSRAGYLTCAGLKKPEFYRRKAFWCEEPLLHLATRSADGQTEDWIPMTESWNYAEGEQIIIKCYTNLPQVALFLNGEEVQEKPELRDGCYQFQIKFSFGILEARGMDEAGAVLLTDCLTSTGNAHQLHCELWQKGDVLEDWPFAQASKQIGYLYQILVTIQDEEERIAVWDNHMIRISVSGRGELAGLDNGDLADVTPYTLGERKTFQGMLAGYIRRTGNGKITIKIESDIPGGEVNEMELD